MPFLEGKLVSDKTINEFAIHVAQHCRESMSYMLSKSDSADSATVNHVMPLLDALERTAPSLFEPGGKLHEYAKEKRALVKNDGKFNPA
ncbi:hypothetical protein GF325_15145 [Candidatus Bathyarchaeota archaeon]|nr:hypothetical protein [Candidatus Bathyarchaeota archaeon]